MSTSRAIWRNPSRLNKQALSGISGFALLRWAVLLLPGVALATEARLMSYNIRYDTPADGVNAWPQRKAAVAELLRQHAPDIFGIQEALPHQISELAAALPDYARFGVGRDASGGGEGVPVFYRKDRFTMLQSAAFWLSETPDKPSRGWDAALNRICSYGQFEETSSRQRLWVINCHFDHAGQTARLESVRLLLSQIEKINPDGGPLVLMGDFNAEPESPPMVLLKQHLSDSRDSSHSPPSGPSGTFSGFTVEGAVTRRIDYLFTVSRGPVEVLEHAVLDDANAGSYPSDHLPVSVRISY
jgi:endonuclease/exonuclease/phosphatase family metal-dependent hydrolase